MNLLALGLLAGSLAATPDYETVVHAESPLPENPVAASEQPANVDVISRAQLEATGAFTLQSALERLGGASLNDEQGNPFQLDLTLRGLKASPVTGLAQGLGVFVDGVRVNEPGAEEVNFDLLPLEAVERIEVIHGPSALFGRNNLAGALLIVTRRGEGPASVHASAEVGTFEHQRYALGASTARGPWDVSATALFSSEKGWRAQSASQQAQLFLKGGYRKDGLDVSLSYQVQRDSLAQPGSLPLGLFREDPSANFTAGDVFTPFLQQAALNLTESLSRGLTLSANAFGRLLASSQYNSNFDGPDSLWLATSRSFGATVQLRHEASFGPVLHRLTVGVEYAHHTVTARLKLLENERSLPECLESGADCPLSELTTVLRDDENAPGAYALEHLRWAPDGRHPERAFTLVGGARYDFLGHAIVDTSPLNTGAASGTARFQQVVPTVGLTYAFSRRLRVFGAFKEGFRPPAFLELTCANPEAPCVGLQAGVAPDPAFAPLRPVLAQDYELGVGGEPLRVMKLKATAYQTDLLDDIGSVSPTPTQVYFQNVGNTRRRGVEASGEWAFASRFAAALSYTFTRATFETPLDLQTSRLAAGVEHVSPGRQLPLVPQHLVRVSFEVELTSWARLSLNGRYTGPQYGLGDEANAEAPVPGYWLFGARAMAHFGQLSVQAQVTNLFNQRYVTFQTWSAGEPFLTPGEPIRAELSAAFDL